MSEPQIPWHQQRIAELEAETKTLTEQRDQYRRDFLNEQAENIQAQMRAKRYQHDRDEAWRQRNATAPSDGGVGVLPCTDAGHTCTDACADLDTKNINEIMDEFDFDRVHKVMVALDWEWAHNTTSWDGIPTVGDLRRQARHELEMARGWSEGTFSGSGGLHIEVLAPHCYRLSFVVCDWWNDVPAEETHA